jgi:hypothetical protein
MTYAAALAEAQDLKATMVRHGVRCSIELQAGRGSDPWAAPAKYLRMHHHTAAWYRAGGNMTPCLALVKTGRPDVIGPLCNGYGGFDLVYRIICMGLANHPGLGGPVTIDGVHVPKDSARGPTWGTEFEGGYQEWTDIPGMLEFMGRADAALAEWTGRPITSQLEHSTWTTRKSDRRNITRANGIALTTRWAGKDDDMQEADFQRIASIVETRLAAARPGFGATAAQLTHQRINDALDPDDGAGSVIRTQLLALGRRAINETLGQAGDSTQGQLAERFNTFETAVLAGLDALRQEIVATHPGVESEPPTPG